MTYTADGKPSRHRVKPALDTAGDVAYDARRREQLRQALHQLNAQAARAAELDAWRQELVDVEWAETWIREHGGSIAAALKRTHPDTGGSAADFLLTQKAREILSR